MPLWRLPVCAVQYLHGVGRPQNRCELLDNLRTLRASRSDEVEQEAGRSTVGVSDADLRGSRALVGGVLGRARAAALSGNTALQERHRKFA